MDAEFLDKLLHLGLFIAAIGFVGVIGVAILERVVGATAPLLRRVHVAIAAGTVVAFAVAERVYHLVA